MVIQNFKTPRNTVALISPALVILILTFLTYTRFYHSHDHALSIGITIDLVITVPLLHVLLSAQRNYLKYSASLFFTAGIIVASIILPKNDQFLLKVIKVWFVPVIELSAIAFFFIKTKKILSGRVNSKEGNRDFYSVFKTITTELFPKRLAAIISAEVSAIYYGFFNWKQPVLDRNTFSYHKKTGILTLIGVFIFMILVETSVFHLLLAKWSVKAAWALSTISLYAAIQAFGIAKSIMKRPVKILDDELVVPYGILAETTIDRKDILCVEAITHPIAFAENAKYLSPFQKIEQPNVAIHLSKGAMINGIYGSEKYFKTLFIHLDEKALFIDQMNYSAH